MNSFTCIGRGHGAPCLPATQESWVLARQSPSLALLCRQIEECQDEDEQKKLKDRMPVWTPRCGEFQNNHRSQSDAIAPLNRQMFDIDQKGHTEEIIRLMIKDDKIKDDKIKDGTSQPKNLTTSEPDMYIGPFLILMVEESVRHGTHVLVVPPQDLSLNDSQALFSQLINLPVDPAVKNVAGCIYMVPEDHVRYQSPRFFTPEVNNEKEFMNNSRVIDGNSRSEYPADYDGNPYTLLVDCLADQLGGVPTGRTHGRADHGGERGLGRAQ